MNPESIAKFAGSTGFHFLPGGQNESVRAGDLVVKPVYEPAKYLWLSECLSNIEFGGLQVAIPVRSLEGNYIEDLVGATKYYDAKFFVDKIERKLDVCRQLNKKVLNVAEPRDFSLWESPWTYAQKLAWTSSENSTIEIPVEIKQLRDLRAPLEIPSQLVHVDLAGNILFDDNDSPVVIDFTPGFYPKEYSEVLLLIDSIAWYKAPIGSLDLLKVQGEIRRQLLLRSLIFRLSVPLFLDLNEDGIGYERNFDEYRPVLAAL